jgi:signal transduction histidine kinase
MLFTRDSRVVLVSASAERFLGRMRRDILGKTAQEIFSDSSPLSEAVYGAFEAFQPLAQREIQVSENRTMQVSLDFIEEKGTPIGALLTMRDAESVRRIEDEIELSRRLSASARTTRSVAHEVKNPINAIVLHLQLLQNKLKQVDPDTQRHMDIIGNEIHRLDRVVQILVDFTRPRELRLEEIDLRKILEEVTSLAHPDAAQHNVTIDRQLPDQPLIVKADSDFMKQAFLNVVLNGVQAMSEGGRLELAARKEDDDVVTEIHDQGPGIPPDVQDKIFELYFTTKKGGSGIGLAQTYQVMQWHYGTVEFESAPGYGTTFRLRMPLASPRPDTAEELATHP